MLQRSQSTIKIKLKPSANRRPSRTNLMIKSCPFSGKMDLFNSGIRIIPEKILNFLKLVFLIIFTYITDLAFSIISENFPTPGQFLKSMNHPLLFIKKSYYHYITKYDNFKHFFLFLPRMIQAVYFRKDSGNLQ